ncbi:hypothetical protein [Zavarzinia sp. CC-PAN008]|uniref:hypothetical protein n=1 Tax=Zavarzinia sp. CC-PAN008 TaxID=3243332 RepID=UPI003F74431E
MERRAGGRVTGDGETRVYREVPSFSREEAERLMATGSLQQALDAMLSIAFNEDDAAWAQHVMLKELLGRDIARVRLAATCLGHIGRIHPQAEARHVIRMLRRRRGLDRFLDGAIEDALSDIRHFRRLYGRRRDGVPR